jgi:outer membrane protein insertion porin family
VLALSVVPAARADVPAEWLGEKVVSVHVIGEAAGRLQERELGVPLGAPLNRALLRAALDRLGQQGRWSDIQIDAVRVEQGVALLFHLVPRLVVRRVDIVGNRALDNREVARVVGLREDSEIDRESFAEVQAALREEYATHGYYDAKAQIVLRDTDDPARKVLRIELREGAPTRIAGVQFRGEALPRRRGVRRLLGLGLGDPADLPRIQEGLDETELLLRRSGYHAAELGQPTLERSGHRARVIVQSSIGPRFEVRFEGAGPISRSELYANLALDQERFSGEGSLRGIEQKLSELYRRYGFRDVRVSAEAEEQVRTVPGRAGERWEEHVMVIGVRIATGAQTVVDAITFPGASHFGTSFLREQVYSYLEQDLPGSSFREPVDSEVVDQLGLGGTHDRRAREVQKPILLDPRRMFHAATYARAVEHIRELYRAEGFLEVNVSEVQLASLQEPNHVIAIISLAEGPRTFLHDVHVENNRQLSGRALLSAAGLSREAPFSYLKLEEARLRMVSACQEQGFFFAKVEPSVRRSEDGTRAEVTFRVEEGYPVRVGAIEVRGAERSKQAMIMDRVRFVLGDLYRPSLARETQDALLRLDVFSSVSVGPDEPNLPSRVKTVVVTVTERKTQWLGWSAGFSTGEGVRGGLEYGYRNLFGSAVHASFRGQLGYQRVFLDSTIKENYLSLPPNKRTEYQATFSLGLPYVPRAPKIALGLDVSVLADIQRDFRMQKESGVASLLYRPHRRWTLSAAEELEFSDFGLFVEQPLEIIGNLTPDDFVPEGRNTLLSSQLTGAWDMRDRSFNAHRGFLISVTSEWARTLKGESRSYIEDGVNMVRDFKSNLLRFTASFAFYVPLSARVTFASQTRYGRVVHLVYGSEAYPNRRFYLGGTNFRGFYQNQMVPQDLEDKRVPGQGIVSRGAEVFVASQNELRFPLVGELYGGVFVDAGNLWTNPQELNLRKLEPVVGLGLRFQTPVASLAFDYGVRLPTRNNESTHSSGVEGAFQFSFQTF